MTLKLYAVRTNMGRTFMVAHMDAHSAVDRVNTAAPLRDSEFGCVAHMHNKPLVMLACEDEEWHG